MQIGALAMPASISRPRYHLHKSMVDWDSTFAYDSQQGEVASASEFVQTLDNHSYCILRNSNVTKKDSWEARVMSIYSSLFSSKNLPTTVWNNGVLYLPEPLASAHKDFLIHNGWLVKYQPSQQGSIGGKTTEDAVEHFINRFLNSAARMQFICAAPDGAQLDVRDMVLDQLGDGHIFLLDLAAGNGAGTLAMLSLLCELRLQKAIPKLPVTVSIFAVDFSEDALCYYREMLDKLKPWLASVGLNLSLKTAVCDMAITGNFNEVLEHFFDDAKQQGVNRFICVISALSGVGKEGIEKMHDSLKMAAAWLSHSQRTSSWLWVEPFSSHTKKPWFRIFLDTIFLKLRKIAYTFSKKAESYEIKTEGLLLTELEPRHFDWYDPHALKVTKSHVVVTAFRNE
ncbi:class I SAM-dependent methyltransferase [Methylococcus sp. EFPC2]|uniref:class I SAM-dependent methyltransferase n=1 Tax=Methylococcus sp. EFPC2 TaxID=2812648 RepID=UPI001966F7D6|nr:class I SAM-dependent methyltransferase [Methylococcus sp. EFPC2]QSA96948.1 hypothetical protein JWZ97_17365 [Methylococcus sp. EFPC2]